MPNADESPLLQAFGGLRVNGAFGSDNIAAGAARVKRAGEACRIACPAGEATRDEARESSRQCTCAPNVS